MSLFKILRGSSSRINISQTPFHDGYCYFTPDDVGFYIDYDDGSTQKRIRINKDDTKVDKETGKGLSTNDYSNAEKTKLSGVEDGATANSITIVRWS